MNQKSKGYCVDSDKPSNLKQTNNEKRKNWPSLSIVFLVLFKFS